MMIVDMRSYVKYEKELEHDFRERLNEAKRLGDVGDVFVEFAFRLLKKVESGIDENLIEDVIFDPENSQGYRLLEKLRKELEEELKTSDLPAILERMAKAAVHRYEHILRDEDRTDVFRRTP
ncbi:MAG: hypothetical protein J7J80_09490 [Thermotogae bacterium]|nr:hypothetical protein [Thermotogota bacterium]